MKPMFDRLGDKVVTDSNNPNPTYWYADSPTENLRIIGLDVYDYPTPTTHDVSLWRWWYHSDYLQSIGASKNPYNNGLSPQQLLFVAKALQDAANKGKAVIVGGHYISAIDWFVRDSGKNLVKLLKAFKNKESGSITTKTLGIDGNSNYHNDWSPITINYDFSNANNSGKIFVLNGHVHYSQYQQFLLDEEETGVFAYTAICVDGNTPYPQGGHKETADILCYDEQDGVRIVRYGGCGTLRQSNKTTGAIININDNRGFFHADEPIKLN